MQALSTFIGFDDPIDLATISLMPITSQAALMGPPAIIPVPEGAVLSNTFPAPSFLKHHDGEYVHLLKVFLVIYF